MGVGRDPHPPWSEGSSAAPSRLSPCNAPTHLSQMNCFAKVSLEQDKSPLTPVQVTAWGRGAR